MVDEEGFRPNVGIIVINDDGNVLWARRIRQNAWQFPQGGILPDESPEEALYRELYEELGLKDSDVALVGCTRGWLRYQLPQQFLRHDVQPLCIGQKQKWFMLRLLSNEDNVCLNATDSPEFDRWRWVNYWFPLKQVIPFKRHVYRRALEELAHHIPAVNRQRHIRKKQVLEEPEQ